MKKVLDPIQDTKWVYKNCSSAGGTMKCCDTAMSCNGSGCTCSDGSTPTEHAGGVIAANDDDDDSVKSSDGSDDDNTCGVIGFNNDKCEATPGCKWFSPGGGIGMCY